ncbi:branched-chain amino acid ABC transporter permease [Bradyrhizobium sp. AUGA SZCCT0182]|uniref:branched-chain amino acid ABC transporter permease n=1 Tax=Bradyrhizobium sp. AUGA SZCCT0182 TaxID=2807667 RepID=UPI00201144BA|nr:branched-chain amino acid ABC transporter permease [Bradyrhizobium sp. AUGA SZCCT0182]
MMLQDVSRAPAEQGRFQVHRDRSTMTQLAVLAAAAIAAFWMFPNDLSFLARVICLAIFVMSLDLVLGFCGIATLGHAALYGIGGYAAGILAVSGGIAQPFVLLACGMIAGAVAGALSGVIIARHRILTQIVVSIALVQLTAAAANKASWLTGGSDGLSGISPGPVFGAEFDIYGRTAYWLAVAILLVVFVLLRRLVRSPFGLLCQAIESDPVRVEAMGAKVRPTLIAMYAISGAVAGLAGALAAITAGVVALDSVSFERSAEALVMLILGGTGTLMGGVLGTVLFQIAEHILSALNPFHWLTSMGVLLVVVILTLPGGIQSIGAQFVQWIKHARWGARRDV